MDLLLPETPARARVALLVPRWTDVGQSEPQGVPFRCFTMGGAFLAAGYEVVFFDQEHDLDRVDRFGELADQLGKCAAAFIWMNEMYPFNQSINAHRLAQSLKDSNPSLPVVVGGEFITACPPEFFDIETPIDYFLRGYGEESGVALVECLRAGVAPDEVPGLVWRGADGALRHRPPIVKALFRAEFLELYRRIDLSCYVQTGGVLGNDQPTLSIATGRGCVKGCRFCIWSKHTSRILGANETFELMAFLRDRYDVKQFHIAELDFFTSRKRAVALADLIARHRPDIAWFALGSPVDLVRLSDADWDRLRAGGLAKVEMGSESGSRRLLRSIGKKHDPEDVLAVSVKMLERGIVPMNNFLFGFPGETRDDRLASLQLIDQLAALSFDRTHFTYRYYQPAWGTGSGDAALAWDPGRPRRIDRWLAERVHYTEEGARTLPWLSAVDEREVKRLINHDLPLATSRLDVASPWRRALYRALRARSRRALHVGGRNRRLDRWLYRRFVAGRLDDTFVA